MAGELILYTTEDGAASVRLRAEGGSVWITQAKKAALFQTTPQNITLHVKAIYAEGELQPEATCKENLQVRQEGGRQVRRTLDYYNLDAIIAVGYRVNSRRATQSRIWATGVFKEYIKKGFVLDDERLKQGMQVFGEDYFRELCERARSIQACERCIWQQITDIFAECSIDYDPKSELTQDFFATVQNKFHHTIAGQTATDIIYAKADRTAPNMGLTTWKNASSGCILPSDITIAKNHLSEPDIKRLGRSVSGFFDYIENLLENRRLLNMAEFVAAIDKFLAFNEYRVLDSRGRVSKNTGGRQSVGRIRRVQQDAADRVGF